MTKIEFDNLKVGDICEFNRGIDAGMKCVVLHKESSEYERNGVPRSMVVLVKPLDEADRFYSSIVAYRYFRLVSHTQLTVLS